MPQDFRRQQIFIDRNVQSALIWRVVGYWCFFLVTTINLVFGWRLLTGPYAPLPVVCHELMDRFCPALLASVALLPLVIIDAVRMSHRFVGPIFRLRTAMRDIAAGRAIHPVKFRTDDYWQEMADEFNAVTAKLSKAEEPLPSEDKLATSHASS